MEAAPLLWVCVWVWLLLRAGWCWLDALTRDAEMAESLGDMAAKCPQCWTWVDPDELLDNADGVCNDCQRKRDQQRRMQKLDTLIPGEPD